MCTAGKKLRAILLTFCGIKPVWNYPVKFSMRYKLFPLAPIGSWHATKNIIYAWIVNREWLNHVPWTTTTLFMRTWIWVANIMRIREISRNKKQKYSSDEKYQWNESFKYETCKTKNLQRWNVILANENDAIYWVAAITIASEIKKTHYSWSALGYECGNGMN